MWGVHDWELLHEEEEGLRRYLRKNRFSVYVAKWKNPIQCGHYRCFKNEKILIQIFASLRCKEPESLFIHFYLLFHLIFLKVEWSFDKTKLEEEQKVLEQREECPICLSELAPLNTRKDCILRCRHRFHTKCILTWAKKNKNCPLCRDSIL